MSAERGPDAPRAGASRRVAWLDVPTAALLVLFNLVPLAGVLWWGWGLQTVLVMYWLESGVIGLLNVPRMLLDSGRRDPSARPPIRVGLPAGSVLGKLVLIPFFLMHYGIFWVVHGVFVFVLPAFGGMADGTSAPGGFPPFATDLDWGSVALGAAGLVAFHVISFLYWELVHGESRAISPEAQMTAPYQRVVILHLTILGGAFLIAMTGQPIAALVVLVGLKTAVDLAAHVREHRARAGGGRR